MFFKKFKKSTSFFLLLLIIIPTTISAYSDYIIPGGENIGIEINTTGVVVVGTYKISDKSPAKEAGIEVGDIIKKVNDTNVTSIDELVNLISNASDTAKITYIRNGKEYETNLSIYKEEDVYKTGLYVKDSITGIGTLSYIDPGTKYFGALGHHKHLWRSAIKIVKYK